MSKKGPADKNPATRPQKSPAAGKAKKTTPRKSRKPTEDIAFPERLVCRDCGIIVVDWNSPEPPQCATHKRDPAMLRWSCVSEGPHGDRPYRDPICRKCSGFAARQAHVDGLGWFGQPAPNREQKDLLRGTDSAIPAPPSEPESAPKVPRSRKGGVAPKPAEPAPKRNKAVGVKGGKADETTRTNPASMTPSARRRGVQNVMARCPGCGFEALDRLEPFRHRTDGAIPDLDAGTCPVCTTPMRWWCAVHSPPHNWLEGPICGDCASAPFQLEGLTDGEDRETTRTPQQTDPAFRQGMAPGLRGLDPSEQPVVQLYHGLGNPRPGSTSRDRMALHGPGPQAPIEGEPGYDAFPGATRLLVASLAMSPGAALAFQGSSLWLAIPAALAGPLALQAIRAQTELTVILGVLLGVAGFWILSRTAMVLALLLILAGASGLVLRDRRIAATLTLLLVLFLLFQRPLFPGLQRPVVPPEGNLMIEEGR